MHRMVERELFLYYTCIPGEMFCRGRRRIAVHKAVNIRWNTEVRLLVVVRQELSHLIATRTT